MVDIIVTVAFEVAKWLFPPIGTRFSYLRNYSINFENLKKEVEKLADARESMQNKVDDARKKGEEIEKRVDKWLNAVDKIIVEEEKLIEDEERANKKCFMGLCPNLKKRYQLSKKAAIEHKAVVGLREEAEKFDQISFHTVPEEAWLTYINGYESFESRMSTLRGIQNALSDPDVNIIGIYGMGGIGKTTLAKEAARQAKNNKVFEEVVFAEVSETLKIEEIQKEIADKIGLKFSEETGKSGRARKLYAKLKNENKILVILDNIWEDLNLETVGIPSGNDCGGCKILLTARNRQLLESMGSKPFPVDILNEEEAWSLFKKMAGDCAGKGELKFVATDIAKECGGLPIAIVTIAKALRNKSSVSVWKDALRQLRKPSTGNFRGVLAKAYSAIELSYKYLRDEELKKTFLQCSLMGYPQESWIVDLLKYGIGLGIWEGINSMEEARDKMLTVVDELKDACLLLDGHTNEWFSMHDVVRDVARSIASRDCNVFSMRNEVRKRKWPAKDKLKECTAISLYDSNITELLERLECPQLEFFYIFTKDSSLEVPDSIFTGMTKLKVLDFTGMQKLSLPSSINLLTDLRTLCLDYDVLADITAIGELKKLEILSLHGSTIEQVPREIGQLTELRLLDLSNCSKLKVIAPNVISSLSQLEELYLANCPVQWEVQGLNMEGSNASLDELKHLYHLTALEIHILDSRILPSILFSKKLERYRILIGDKWGWIDDDDEAGRLLKLKLNSSICLEEWQCMKNVEYLCLDELQGFTNVLYELDGDGFSQLKHLNVQNNPHFLRIVDSKHLLCDAFPLLEWLVLDSLINLECICHGCQLKAESFCNLKTIKVKMCDKLKNCFSFSVAKFLPRLQTIEVIKCNNLEDIFAFGIEYDVSNEEVIAEIELRHLRSLILETLPQFTSFSAILKTSSTMQARHKELATTETWSNEIISKNEHCSLTSLFNEKALELSAINVAKIWHNQLSAMSCNVQNLTRLIVRDCDKLKYIFPSFIAKRLEQLQHLEILNCTVLEEIVVKEDEAESDATFFFPRLTVLELDFLPELRVFYPGIHTSEWPMLTKLEVIGCDKLKCFNSELFSFEENNEDLLIDIPLQQPLFLVEKVFPNLEELRLSSKDIMMILHRPFPEHLFCKIKVLEIRNDESAALSLDLFERFLYLEKLELNFSSYKELFSNGGQVKKHVGKLAQIKYLRLWGLMDLKHLWGQNSKSDMVFQSLEILVVSDCNILKNLMPSSASFRYLTELKVSGCKELINMVTSSTAKSLVQLVTMMVKGCNKMTEVVASEGDAANNEIIFSKLQFLSLSGLESLTSFCSGNCTFKFPSLIDLAVEECPKMKIFSEGVLSAPRLKEVKQDFQQDEGSWEGDLNTTIQHLHHKMY